MGNPPQISVPPPKNSISNTFFTPQTLSLPAASGGIWFTWQVIGRVYDKAKNSDYVPVGLAVLVGIVFYFLSDKEGADVKEKLLNGTTAFFNTVMLAAAALGIHQ